MVVSTRGPGLLPARALELFERAEAELVAATFSQEPDARFRHAHLAALRTGAAVLAVLGRPSGRGMPRSVWGLLPRVAPELAGVAAFFASGAPAREAIEAGLPSVVGEDRADAVLAAAEDFLAVARALTGGRAPGARAS